MTKKQKHPLSGRRYHDRQLTPARAAQILGLSGFAISTAISKDQLTACVVEGTHSTERFVIWASDLETFRHQRVVALKKLDDAQSRRLLKLYEGAEV